MNTFVTKPAEVERSWYVVDAESKVLGRLAAGVASVLRGKKKPIYQPNVDAGDYVIVVNAEKVILTGMKEDDKTYFSHSGYIGNAKNIAVKKLREKHPERIVEKAIKGMLPHNALGRAMYRKLHVYKGPDHNQKAQKPELLEI